MDTNVTQRRALGAAILERLTHAAVPTELRPHVRRLRAAHQQFEAAAQRVEATRKRRDRALEAITEADRHLDEGVEILATAIIGARMNPRGRAFLGFSAYRPSELKNLGYRQEIREVRDLVKRVAARKPPPAVAQALTNCLKLANAVEQAIAAVARPQAAYDHALSTRDDLFPEWQTALRKLKRQARATWDEQPSKYRRIFQAPKTGRQDEDENDDPRKRTPRRPRRLPEAKPTVRAAIPREATPVPKNESGVGAGGGDEHQTTMIVPRVASGTR